jgi:hypothetical protein
MNFYQYEETIYIILDIKECHCIHGLSFWILNSLRSIFDDSNKLFQLSVVHKWVNVDWDFETKLKEEVVW